MTDADRLIFIMEEIAIAKGKIQPTATGHIHTSISYMESRVEEIREKLNETSRK